MSKYCVEFNAPVFGDIDNNKKITSYKWVKIRIGEGSFYENYEDAENYMLDRAKRYKLDAKDYRVVELKDFFVESRGLDGSWVELSEAFLTQKDAEDFIKARAGIMKISTDLYRVTKGAD